MRMPPCLAVITLVGLSNVALAQDKPAAPYPAMAPIEQYRIANVQDEIALARSAAPPSISADAEVLVLGQQGYQVAARGSNGFVCMVERSWDAGFDDPGFWNPKIRGPDCFNPPAVRSVLPQFLKRTEWVLAGASRQQALDKAKSAFASHEFIEPAAGSFTFMLSKQGYLGDDAGGPWRPHVMLFVPHGGAAAGAGSSGSPVLGHNGGPYEPTVLFIPVSSWSDGSPAQAAGEHHH